MVWLDLAAASGGDGCELQRHPSVVGDGAQFDDLGLKSEQREVGKGQQAEKAEHCPQGKGRCSSPASGRISFALTEIPHFA